MMNRSLEIVVFFPYRNVCTKELTHGLICSIIVIEDVIFNMPTKLNRGK